MTSFKSFIIIHVGSCTVNIYQDRTMLPLTFILSPQVFMRGEEFLGYEAKLSNLQDKYVGKVDCDFHIPASTNYVIITPKNTSQTSKTCAKNCHKYVPPPHVKLVGEGLKGGGIPLKILIFKIYTSPPYPLQRNGREIYGF